MSFDMLLTYLSVLGLWDFLCGLSFVLLSLCKPPFLLGFWLVKFSFILFPSPRSSTSSSSFHFKDILMSIRLRPVIWRISSGLTIQGGDSSCSMVSVRGWLLWIGVVVSLVVWSMGVFWSTLTVCKWVVQFGSEASGWGNWLLFHWLVAWHLGFWIRVYYMVVEKFMIGFSSMVLGVWSKVSFFLSSFPWCCTFLFLSRV